MIPHNIDENTHSFIRLADWLASGERVEIEEKTTSFSHVNVFYGLFDCKYKRARKN